MLKTAALALVVLVTGSIGADSALAGGQTKVRHPPISLGKVQRGGKVKVFRPTKIGHIIIFQRGGKSQTAGPDRLPS
jgi:hypothetical protein